MTPKTCTCERPVPIERSERKGTSRTECARCGLPVPLAMRPPGRVA
ncbi:MAG TPA: hypothetical protein VNB86_00520 [Gaiellaceae bacterium]|jgi:hypothetical protein|nr:hypothetical protein [Gaiellaceae bacterium]